MRHRLMVFAAVGLALTLNPPIRSYGQQGQGQPGQNPQQAQAQGQGEAVVEAVFGYARQQGGQPGQNQSNQTGQKPGQPHQGQGQGQQPRQQGKNSAKPQTGQQSQNNSANPSQGSWIAQVINPGSEGRDQQILHYLNGLAYFDDGGRNSGMTLASADDALRTQLKLSKDEGLIVTAVETGSLAAQAGIEPNDVLLRIGGKVPQGLPLGKPEDLEEGLKAAGDTPVGLLLLRRGHRLGLRVQPRVRVSLGPVRPDPPSYWIGVSVAGIESALRSQLQLPQKGGLLALDVVKDSPGAKAGIRPHDILLKLDGEDLTDQDKLIQIVQARGEKTISLELVREGKREAIPITPQRRKSVNVAVNWDKSKPGVGNLSYTINTYMPTGSNTVSGTPMYSWVVPILPDLDKQPQNTDPATAKRLDDLTAQIKELRQAIEALTKAPPMQKK